MISLTKVLRSTGIIRPIRHSGFCPACEDWIPGNGETQQNDQCEVNPAALTVLVVLVVAAAAWILTVGETQRMGAGMGLGSLQSFAKTWVVMMAAMMLPSALPMVYEFARSSEGRRGWQVATAALGAVYLL